MRRTQISLTQSEHEFVRRGARRRGVSMAAFIRDLIQERMAQRHPLPPDHPLRNIIGIGRGDGSPVSEKHDEYIYTLPRRGR